MPDETTDDWLPAASGGSRSVGGRLLAGLLVLVLVVLAWATVLLATGLTAMDRVEVGGLGGSAGVTNVLVVGSDSRDELSQEQQQELTTGGDAGDVRTDTILLVQTRGQDVALLSFPRDLWVERCDGTEQRINTTVQLDGLGCLADTVEQLSGIGIDHVVEVGFEGFVDVVDAVGGVEVCLPQPIADADAGIDLPQGCQTLAGPEALGYVRVRKIDDDLQRIRRQQEFLGALADRIVSPGTLLLPTRALPTARALGDAVTTDTGVGPLTLVRLGNAARGLAGGGALAATVPTEPAVIGGADVLLPTPEADEVFARFRSGRATAEAAEADSAAGPRSDTRVVVLNGAGVGGLAGRTAEALGQAGYDVLDVGNSELLTQTTIQHPPGLRAEAERLATDITGVVDVEPVLREGAEGDAVTLVLGRDLAGG